MDAERLATADLLDDARTRRYLLGKSALECARELLEARNGRRVTKRMRGLMRDLEGLLRAEMEACAEVHGFTWLLMRDIEAEKKELEEVWAGSHDRRERAA